MKLTINEQKMRDLYLRKLALGEIQGPLTGKPSKDKVWLKYYSEEAIKKDKPKQTMYQYVYSRNKDYLYNTAFNYFGIKTNFDDFFQEINKIAYMLKNDFNIKAGDAVTLCMPNTPEAGYTIFALNKLGAVANLTDPRFTEEELRACVTDSKSRLVITLDDFVDKIDSSLDGVNADVINVSALNSLPLPIKAMNRIKNGACKTKSDGHHFSWNKLMPKKVADVEVHPYQPNDACVIVYTGGTTGTSKGVVLTNDNFTSFVEEYTNVDVKMSRKDKFLNFIPLWTAYGACGALFMPLALGMEDILVPKTKEDEMADLIMKYKPNHCLGVPKTWDVVIKNPRLQKEDLSYLVTIGAGADHMTVALENRINNFLQAHNCKSKVSKGYGMTEACSSICTCSSSCTELNSVGAPLVYNNLSIVNPETNNELGYNELGEICVNGPTVMKHYLNNPEETNKVLKLHNDNEMWLHSGDIGYITSDGKTFIVDRIKRMFIKGGFKIYCSQIENEFSKNPAIDSIATVGIADDIEGHVPMIHIVLKPEYVTKEQEVIDELNQIAKDKLPEYYLPLRYSFDESLPFTKNEKIDFVKLRADDEAKDKTYQKTLRK